MKKWLMAVLLGTVLVLGACGGDSAEEDTSVDESADTEEAAEDDAGDTTVDSDVVEAAETAYGNSCAGCHGDDLSGGVGPDLNAVGSSLSAEEIEDIIENGLGSMPSVSLSDEDRSAVAEWLAAKK